MIVRRKSARTGDMNEMDLDVTQEQLDAYTNGQGLVQQIFPDLTPGEREFIKTGYTEADWAAMFPPEED